MKKLNPKIVKIYDKEMHRTITKWISDPYIRRSANQNLRARYESLSRNANELTDEQVARAWVFIFKFLIMVAICAAAVFYSVPLWGMLILGAILLYVIYKTIIVSMGAHYAIYLSNSIEEDLRLGCPMLLAIINEVDFE
jgi:hypothetical protein